MRVVRRRGAVPVALRLLVAAVGSAAAVVLAAPATAAPAAAVPAAAAAATAVSAAAVPAAAAAASAADAVAETLAGEEVAAPDDLGSRSLLVVSFHRAANAGAREWRSALDDAPAAEGWSIYSVVVLEGAPGFVRRMVVRTMRGEVEAARHGSYLVVEEGADAWRTLAGSDGDAEDREDAVFVARLEGGKVCARFRGLVSGAALTDLLGASC